MRGFGLTWPRYRLTYFSLYVGHHSCYLSALQRQIIVIAAERFVLCESIRGLKNRGSFHPSIFLPSFSQLSSSFLPLSLSPPSCARKNSSTFPLSLSRNGRKNGRALFYSVNVFFHSSNAAVPWDSRTGLWASGTRTRMCWRTGASCRIAVARHRPYSAEGGIIRLTSITRYRSTLNPPISLPILSLLRH